MREECTNVRGTGSNTDPCETPETIYTGTESRSEQASPTYIILQQIVFHTSEIATKETKNDTKNTSEQIQVFDE